MARDGEIRSRLERVEEIVERLEAGQCSRSVAESFYEEGLETLDEVQELLDRESGEIIELE